MEHIDGYISKINLNGKIYALKCEVIETHPIICKNCGNSFELQFGHGKCDYCGTYYTTNFYIEETK